jgi:hypothetical protein
LRLAVAIGVPDMVAVDMTGLAPVADSPEASAPVKQTIPGSTE